MELKATTAVITGSSGRLGREIALALAHAGCNCICHYSRNEKAAQQLVNEIQKADVNALAVHADLAKTGDIENLFDKALTFGVPQVLINSAAVFSRGPLNSITFEEARKVLDINLTAAIMTSREFAKRIEDNLDQSAAPAGKIINISGIGGIRPWANFILYCSSKAGLIGATKALAKELAPQICVNSVAPGMATWPPGFTEQQKKRQLKMIPLARIAEPEDVTNAIIFLLKNDYITGQVLNVDGGRCI